MGDNMDETLRRVLHRYFFPNGHAPTIHQAPVEECENKLVGILRREGRKNVNRHRFTTAKRMQYGKKLSFQKVGDPPEYGSRTRGGHRDNDSKDRGSSDQTYHSSQYNSKGRGTSGDPKGKKTPGSNGNGKSQEINSAFLIIFRKSRKGNPMYVLLQKRSRNADHGAGQLGLVGGMIEKNETPEHAAVHECKEESGINIKSNELESLGTVERAKIFSVELDTNNDQIPGPERNSKKEVDLTWGTQGHKWLPIKKDGEKIVIENLGEDELWKYTKQALKLSLRT